MAAATGLKIKAAKELQKASAEYAALLEDDEKKSKEWRSVAGNALKSVAEGDSKLTKETARDIMKLVAGGVWTEGGCCSSNKLEFPASGAKLTGADTSADVVALFLSVDHLPKPYYAAIQDVQAQAEAQRNKLLQELRNKALEVLRAQKAFEGADQGVQAVALGKYQEELSAAKREYAVKEAMDQSPGAMLNRLAAGRPGRQVRQDIKEEKGVAGELAAGQDQLLQDTIKVRDMATEAKEGEDEKIKQLSKDVLNRAQKYFSLEGGDRFQAEFFIAGDLGAQEFTGATSNSIIECCQTVERLAQNAQVEADMGSAGSPWKQAVNDIHGQLVTAATYIKKVLLGYKKLNREMKQLSISLTTWLETYEAANQEGVETREEQRLAGQENAVQSMAQVQQVANVLQATK